LFQKTWHMQSKKKLKHLTLAKTPSILPPTPKITHVPVHYSWIDLPEEEFARQLTLLDFAAFRAIKTSELFNKNWISPDACHLSPNVSAMILRWNRLCAWVPSALVTCEKLKDRVRVYARLVRIAQQLRELNNFNGLMAFMMGLRGPSVSRLKFTIEELPKKEKKILQALEGELFDENVVTTKYRELLRKASPPCVPYVNFILKDLLVVENEPNETKEATINFRKRRDIYNVISRLDQYTTCDYSLVEVIDVVNLLNKLEPLAEAENYKLSNQIEPKNARR